MIFGEKIISVRRHNEQIYEITTESGLVCNIPNDEGNLDWQKIKKEFAADKMTFEPRVERDPLKEKLAELDAKIAALDTQIKAVEAKQPK